VGKPTGPTVKEEEPGIVIATAFTVTLLAQKIAFLFTVMH
jgi:hypothetical protein